MQLLQMSIENFRIFYGKHTFSFKDKKLVILRGLNGHGKSSFFDAIEWCLTGDIQRYVGSAERQKFHYIVHQSLFSQSASANHIGPQASVEVWIKKSDDEYFTIKRVYHAQKKIPKPIFIDGIAYAVKPGNQKIRDFLLHTLIENYGENKKEVSKVELPLLLASTQFLSQDQLQAFVSAKKPQERYAVLEKVLGIQKYGSEFQQYIKNVKEVVEGQKEAVSKEIKSKSEQVKIKQGIADTKEDLLNKIGGETEETFLEKIAVFIGKINEAEIGLPQVQLQTLTDSTQTMLLEYRKLLQERTIASESKRRLLQEFETVLSLSDIDCENRLLELTDYLEGLNKKSIDYESKKQRAINKQVELNSLKGYRTHYRETILLANNLRENIKEKRDAQEQILKNPTLLTVIQLYNDLEKFQHSYADQLNQYNRLQEYLLVLEKEKKIQSITNTLDQIKQRLATDSILLEQKNNNVIRLREKKKQIEQMVEDHKNDTVAQMIHNVQSYLLHEDDEYAPCPVCGSPFLEPSSLHDAIKLQLEETNKALDKNDVDLRELNTELNTSEAEEADLSRVMSGLIRQRDTLINQLQQEEVAAASDRAKIPVDIQQFNEEQVRGQTIKLLERLNLNEAAFNLCLALERLEAEIDPMAAQEVTLSQTLQDLRKIAEKRVRWLSTEGVIEHRLQRLDMYLLRLKDAENHVSSQKVQWNAKLREVENQKREKELKLIEIRNFIPGFTVEERQSQLDPIIRRIDLLRNWDAELEEQLLKIEAFLSRSNIMALKNELSVMVLELTREEDNSKYYEGLLDQLKQLDEDHGKIQSELMNEYLQSYSEKIDELFMQISPHAFFRHVHLVPKEGELYIVVSDKKEHDLSKLSPEELEKRFNASLTFSSAQSNVLAICIFLALGLSQEWTPLRTIGIDDPFQNLDDINVFSFLDVLSQILLDKQVIISTHDDKFANLIRFKSSLESHQITEIWLESYSKEGISIQSDCLVGE
ncbi:exonuclease SbcC [Paenibacillus endophyticus]|uniref:Nuclease SbcCD subunit C n=1 Tax=Paenibacillus endophyticus TaxID=1294268 RepID=A0A7W5C845_9BACL|nr:SMC family ATPase [Paenibacillus endophyticus]MBB3152475.1 exonuclease SbcC [Paenibacillus endophyticus]